MCMAKQARCDQGAKAQECRAALGLFQEVAEWNMLAESWWMAAQISKHLNDDVRTAVELLKKAVQPVGKAPPPTTQPAAPEGRRDARGLAPRAIALRIAGLFGKEFRVHHGNDVGVAEWGVSYS